MYYHEDETGYKELLPGVMIKTLVCGGKTLMTEFRLEKDSELPMHSHPYEQTGYCVSGRLRLTIGDETEEIVPGDAWNIAPDVMHGAELIEDSVAIEIFSPVREDYLPENM